MANEEFTQLPAASNAELTDIICAVQGYTSSNNGESVQETLGQIISLANSNIILNYAGNPNGNVAGTRYQTLCWDTDDIILWICTATGNASAARWFPVNATGGSLILEVISSNASINNAVGYYCASVSPITLTLPTVANVGAVFCVNNFGTGGFTIAQNANQYIRIGTAVTTVGAGGSVASTAQGDSVYLVCVIENTAWTNITGPQGNLTIV